MTGCLALETDHGVVEGSQLGGRQARLVFAFLAVERHRPIQRDELADALWPDRLPDFWGSALRTLMSKVRCFLSTAGLPSQTLTNAFSCYQLRLPEEVAVDLDVAVGTLAAAERAFEAGDFVEACSRASISRAIASRPFLPGEEGAWVDRVRERQRAWLCRSLDVISDASIRCADFKTAEWAAGESIVLEPYREAGYARLMRLQAAAGNRGDALRSYARVRSLLSDELGVDPSPDLESVHREVLRGVDPEATGPLPPSVRLDAASVRSHERYLSDLAWATAKHYQEHTRTGRQAGL